MNASESRFMMLLAAAPLSWVGLMLATLPTMDALPFGEHGRHQAVALTLVPLAVALVVYRTLAFRPGRSRRFTIGWTGLLFSHLVLYQPLFATTNCVNPEMLLGGQTLAYDGLWIALCAISWFGFNVLFRRTQRCIPTHTQGVAMNRSAARMTLCFSMVFLLPGIFWIVAAALVEFSSLTGTQQLAVSYLAATLTAVAIWILTWRTTVSWTGATLVGTALVTIPMLASPLTALYTDVPTSETINMIFSIAPLLSFGFWILGTALIWKRPFTISASLPRQHTHSTSHTDPVRDAIRCGQCSYSLRGLREVRCPECGWTATLDAVVRDTLLALSNE